MVMRRHATFGELKQYEHFVLPGKTTQWQKVNDTTGRCGVATSYFPASMPVERRLLNTITPL